MKSFQINLIEYKRNLQLSHVDLAELCEMPEGRIEELTNGKLNYSDIYKLCGKLSIDFTSIFSDDGLAEASLFDQFDAFPQAYRAIVTKVLIRRIQTELNNRKIYKPTAKELLPFDSALAKRIYHGKAAFSASQLLEFRAKVAEYLPEAIFDEVLAQVMFSRIVNYNYCVAKDHFHLSYSQIATMISRQMSTAANWGGKTCVLIPDTTVTELCKAFGGIDEKLFRTQLLKDSSFKGTSCHIPQASPKQKVKKSKRVSDLAKTFPDEIKSVSAELHKEGDQNIRVCEPNSNPPSLITFDNDKVMKMYKNLDVASKAKVNELITFLFFESL